MFNSLVKKRKDKQLDLFITITIASPIPRPKAIHPALVIAKVPGFSAGLCLKYHVSTPLFNSLLHNRCLHFFFDKQVRCWNKVSFERNLIDLPFLSLEYSQQSLSASSTIDFGSPNKY